MPNTYKKFKDMDEKQLEGEVTGITGKTLKKELEDSYETGKKSVEKELEGKGFKIEDIDNEIKKLKEQSQFKSNIQVGEEKTYPKAAIAMAKILEKRYQNGKTYLDIMKDENERSSNPHIKAGLAYERKNLESIDTLKADRFNEKTKSLGLGNVMDGARVGMPGVQPGLISELLPDIAFNQVPGITRVGLINGKYEVPVETDGPDMLWGGEAEEMAEKQLKTKTESLEAKKGYVLVSITNDRLRFDNTNFLATIEASMDRKLRNGVDRAYIQGVGNSHQPRGVFNYSFDSLGADNSPTAQTIKSELISRITAMQDENVKFNGAAWLMSPSKKTVIANAYDSDSKLAHYAKMLWDNNNLFGYPVITSNNCPVDEVGLIDGSHIYIGEANGFYIDADGSSGFNTDTTKLRIVTYTDLQFTHKKSKNQAYGSVKLTDTGNWKDV